METSMGAGDFTSKSSWKYHRRGSRGGRAVMRGAFLLLCSAAVVATLGAQESVQAALESDTVDPGARPADALIPEIFSHSGTPPLIELRFPDPGGETTAVTVETPVSTATYEVSPDPERESIHLTLSPFMEPGVYDMEVSVRAGDPEEGQTVVSRARIGFVDYVFGHNNLSFGNNAEYESIIGTYGEILASWLTSRFGSVADSDLILLVDFMYQLFGSRSGRCYAFAGSEVRFWHWPDLLPTYYDEAYDLRGTVRKTQEDMNFLQIDMAFDHFLAGGYDPDQGADGTRLTTRHEAMMESVEAIMDRIATGEPVVAGFRGPAYHHAMVVYGFIQRPERGTVDLLVANNWKSDQDLNLRSKNAETVRVFLEPTEDGPLLEWRYVDGTRNKEIDQIFIVEVKREYTHDVAHLDALIGARRNQVVEDRRAVLVVEDAAGAWLTNGEVSTGYDRRRTTEEVEDVLFDKVNRTYRFDYPADAELWLEVADDAGARVLHYYPGPGAGDETAWIMETPVPEDDAVVRRQVFLGTNPPMWEVVSEPDE